MDNIKLPSGWTSEQWCEVGEPGRFIVLCAPGQRGFITIDFKHRVARTGWSSFGLCAVESCHRGRGWKQSLVDSAVRYLEGVLK